MEEEETVPCDVKEAQLEVLVCRGQRLPTGRITPCGGHHGAVMGGGSHRWYVHSLQLLVPYLELVVVLT